MDVLFGVSVCRCVHFETADSLLMMQTLHDLICKSLMNRGSIEFVGSHRMSIIASPMGFRSWVFKYIAVSQGCLSDILQPPSNFQKQSLGHLSIERV